MEFANVYQRWWYWCFRQTWEFCMALNLCRFLWCTKHISGSNDQTYLEGPLNACLCIFLPSSFWCVKVYFFSYLKICTSYLRIFRWCVIFFPSSFAGKETLRCLALALNRMPMGQQSLSFDDENDLTFIGLVCSRFSMPYFCLLKVQLQLFDLFIYFFWMIYEILT